jgi:hypothetical protein
MNNFKIAIVDLWTFIHQPVIKFNKYTYKKSGKNYKAVDNSLMIHANKHPEITNLGKKIAKDDNISDTKAYKIAMKYLAIKAYKFMRQTKENIMISSYEHNDFFRSRWCFNYNNNNVIIIIDSYKNSPYDRKITGVSCYFKTTK